jgi:group I intron endonuclease
MYIYKIENKINGKIYIGQSIYIPDNTKKYMGSGLLIKKAILKYGVDVFDKTILCECNTKTELNEREIYYIDYYNSIKNGYNISTGGNGGNLGDIVNNKISNSVKNLWLSGYYDAVDYSQSHPCSNDTREKISNSQSGENGYWYGKSFSINHKNNIRIKTKLAYENGAYENFINAMRSNEVRDKISKSLKGSIPWNAGKTGVYTEEQIKRMSDAAKNRTISPQVEQTRRDKISKHFLENHPNKLTVLDTRTGTTYNSIKEFCSKTDTSWYCTKKLRKENIIIITK